MEQTDANYETIIFRPIDEMKECGIGKDNEQRIRVWLDTEDIQLDEHDFEIVAAFLKSESTSIASYLKEQNKQLDILNYYTETEQSLGIIQEETENSLISNKLQNQSIPFEEETIPQPTSINISHTSISEIENNVPMEYELVSMIQIKRVASSLSSLHRYIYYDLPTISEEQEQFMINQLQQEEGENAIITAFYVSQVHTDNNIPDFFPCKTVVCTVWQLQENSENAAETVLFSSWKTKVNKVSRSVLNTPAIGFVDITNQGIYMYQ